MEATSLFATPTELVRGLTELSEQARDQLGGFLGDDIARLVRHVADVCRITEDRRRLAHRTLCWVEMYLLSRGPDEWERFSGDAPGWGLFRSYLLVKAVKLFLWDPEPDASFLERIGFPIDLVSEPDGGRWDEVGDDLISGTACCYEIRWYGKPLEQVSGDLVEHVWGQETLWVLLADGCGKSWLARILVRGVSELWRAYVRDPQIDPAGVLDRLQAVVEPCLPEGFFVDALLARFRPGEVAVSSAGPARFLCRKGRGARPRLREHNGYLLGVDYGPTAARWQGTWDFRRGDEVLLASDGLYEQPAEGKTLRDAILDALSDWQHAESLHAAVIELIQRTLEREGRQDDITVVTVRRC